LVFRLSVIYEEAWENEKNRIYGNYYDYLASIIAAGIILPAQSTVSNDEKYAVGGEITPINETPFILNPYALAAIATVIVVITASIALKKFPIKIVIEKA